MTINPYQPTAEVSETLIDDSPDPLTVLWGTWSVYWRTVLAVGFSGFMFGGACSFFPVVFNLGTEGLGEFLAGMLFLIPIAGIFGAIFALLAGLPTAGVLILFFWIASPGRDWSRSRIRWFAISSGLLSGFFCLTVPSGFDRDIVAFSLVAGGFGAVFSWLAMWYLCRNMPSILPEPNRTSESTPLSIPVDAI